MERNPNSFGIVGSDLLGERPFAGSAEVIAPVVNDGGQVLRFGLISRPGRCLSESLDIITSYPESARRILARYGIAINSLECVGGKVEAEVGERDLIGFELIQSGNSVIENELAVLEDYLETINLVEVAANRGIYGGE